jgi:hypothetical protein
MPGLVLLCLALSVLCVAPSNASGSTTPAATLAATPSAAPSVPTSGAQLSIAVTPNPGYVGGSVTVDFVVNVYGSLDGDAMTVVVYPTLPAGISASAMPAECVPVANGGCALPGEYSSPTTLTVSYTLSPTAAGSSPIVGQLLISPVLTGVSAVSARPAAVAPGDLQAPVSDVLNVLQPSISILPPVAAPGQVVLVEGRDFPPGSIIALRWNPGITAAATPPAAGADGAFTTQLLVMGGDQTGAREAVASGTGFTAVDAPFLVTPDRLMPPLLGAAG